MARASASMSLLAECWEQIEHFIPTEERIEVAKALIEQFKLYDAEDMVHLLENDTLKKASKEIQGENEDEDEYEDYEY